MTPTLYPYQKEGVAYLRKRRFALLADDPGLGKTIQALSALPTNVPVMVVCPKIAVGVWQNEAKVWAPSYRVRKSRGRKQFAWPQPGEILIVTYDGFPTTVDDWPVRGTFALLDEVQYLRTDSSRRAESLRAHLKCVDAYDGSIWGFTGTPVMNRPLELWNVLEALRLHKKAYGAKKTFVKIFGGAAVPRFDYRTRDIVYTYEWDQYPRDEEAIRKGFRAVALRRTKEAVLPDLPECTYEELVVPTNLEVSKAYQQISQALKQTGRDFGEMVELIEQGRYMGEIGVGVMAQTRQALAVAKIPHMMDIVELSEDNEEPLVVFSAHRAPVVALEGRSGWGTITGDTSSAQRRKIIADFQAGHLFGVAATINTAGVATTMTRASHCLFVDCSWVPANNRQAKDRLHRIGQKNNVRVTSLLFDHPMELRVHEVCLSKTVLENQVYA